MNDNTQFVMTVLGAILMLLPSAVQLYWGDLSNYLFSYIMAKYTIPESVIGAPWLVNSFAVMWIITIPIGGYIVKFIGRRAMLIASAVIFNLSLVMCYFIIDTSALALMLFLGVIGGIGSGLPHGLVL